MQLKIKKVRENAKIPTRATSGSAGMDMYACLDDAGVDIKPGERTLVPTGVAIELPDHSYVALLFSRSGLSIKQGLGLINGVGVIDSDYRGEMSVPLINHSDATVHIAGGDRIAQLVITPVVIPDIVETEDLGGTQRGEGGFGSTGSK